jgi:hypothetical protein
MPVYLIGLLFREEKQVVVVFRRNYLSKLFHILLRIAWNVVVVVVGEEISDSSHEADAMLLSGGYGISGSTDHADAERGGCRGGPGRFWGLVAVRKAVGLAPSGAEIHRVVGPIDQWVVATKPRFAQDKRNRAKLGDLENDVFQVLVD